MKTNVKKAKKNKKVVQSTSEEFVESLSPRERAAFEAGYRDFLISELILAIMEQDEISVRKLAELADVSPTVVQAMKSGTKKDFSMQSFFKILKGLGFKKFSIEKDGQSYPLDISRM